MRFITVDITIRFLFALACWSFRDLRFADAGDLVTGQFDFADIKVQYHMVDLEPTKPDTPVILFLHGQKFSSENWVNLGTLKLMNSIGYRTAAIDLPGHGKTRDLPYIDNNMRAEFLKTAFDFFGNGSNLTAVGAVLVSPSMSGRWAIPFLDRYGTMLMGWIPIAPAGVGEWGGPWEDTHKKVRLLAMYGSNDPLKEEYGDIMKLFKHSSKAIVKDANHACYIDQPEQFHSDVAYFLDDAMKDHKIFMQLEKMRQREEEDL